MPDKLESQTNKEEFFVYLYLKQFFSESIGTYGCIKDIILACINSNRYRNKILLEQVGSQNIIRGDFLRHLSLYSFNFDVYVFLSYIYC